MRSFLLLFLHSHLFHEAISSACFTLSPWKNVRSLVGMLDSCSTTADCENECLTNSQCDAYVFSTRCALFGVDSGKPQCIQSGANYWQRLPSCGGAKPASTVTPASTTTTKASSEIFVYFFI
ncbi:hypothetical protein PRIPAC_81801 [Pristionchus pacificus]|uniref:Apple domain-containing protein n=1 Tax=Pristionchus pacificus TaxID=54126 RepID=A0A2A6C2I9_PRIPA|nr:hypothetical protein PRIPAC_81801 [Pristionchus pacificus]|eukprot:PDM72385.1 hypothetical protein PRIPAC_38819 [Pristionchus pacificus]